MEHQNPEQSFRVGDVIAHSFSILFRNIVPFGVLSAIVLSPSFLMTVYVGDPLDSLAAGIEMGDRAVLEGLSSILTVVLSLAVTGALVYGASRDLSGHKVGIGECLGRGLATLLPVLGVLILASLGVGIASLLLIVPGIILYVMWWVALPVAVIERPGVIASLKRSAELTKGKRWSVFGVLLITVLISMVLNGVATFGGLVAGYLGMAILVWIVQSFTAAFGAIVVAVGYYRLRGEKEGLGVESIASVFD